VTKKRKKSDSLISVLEHALNFGETTPYNRSWKFVRSLENVKDDIQFYSWFRKK